MIYVQLCSAYAPAWAFGGVVRILYGYARHMSARHPTWVLAGNLDERQQVSGTEFDKDQPYAIVRYGVASRRLARRNVHCVSPRMLWDLLALAIRNPGPVVVHVSEFRGAPCLYALAARLLLGARVKIVHSAFGGLHEKPSRLRRGYDRLFTGAFLKRLDLALAQNEHEADEYRRLMSTFGAEGRHDRVKILPLQVDDLPDEAAGWFSEGAKRPERQLQVRRHLGLPGQALVFSFLGRFHPEKGILRAIDVFCAWKARYGGADDRFVIIGRDEGFEAQVRAHASASPFADSIDIVTGVYAERFSWLFAADIFIGLPTMFEETMLASLEAMSCGTPVLLSREADAPHVEEEGAGHVIDFDPETAVLGLASLVENRAEASRNALLTIQHFRSPEVLRELEARILALP